MFEPRMFATSPNFMLPADHRFVRHFVIVEMNPLLADDLICLVSFAGYHHNVALSGLLYCTPDSLSTVSQLHIGPRRSPQADFNVCDDRLGVLRSRIVRCNYREIAQAGGDFTHRRALGAIAIAAAAEDRYHASRVTGDFACGLQHILQSVISVSVVHDHRERRRLRTGQRHLLESTRNGAAFGDAAGDVLQTGSQSQSCGDCTENVVNVKPPDKPGEYLDFAKRSAGCELQPSRTQLEIIRADVGTVAKAVADPITFRGPEQSSAILVVGVNDRDFRLGAESSGKKLRLRRKVVLHCSVVIQMIARKIGERGDLELQSVRPM